MNEYDKSGKVIKIVDDTMTLKITPKSPMKKDTSYELVFQKKSNKAMRNDERASWHTPKELSLSDFKLVSNTEGCIYANNNILESETNTVTTTPLSRVPKIRFDYGQMIWDPS